MIDQRNLWAFHRWPRYCSRLVRMSVKQRSVLSDNNLYNLTRSVRLQQQTLNRLWQEMQTVFVNNSQIIQLSVSPPAVYVCSSVGKRSRLRKAPRWMLTPLSQRCGGYIAVVKHSAFAFPLMFFIRGKPNMSVNKWQKVHTLRLVDRTGFASG